MRSAITLLLLIACGLACQAQQIQQILVFMAMGNVTTPSLGEFNSDGVIRQSNRNSAGAAAAWELWKRGNGFVVEYSFTPTDAKLFALDPAFKDTKVGQWPLDRNKFDFLYEHRFRGKERVHPYLGLGGFVVVLWGGSAPAHSNVNASGLDAWGGEVTTTGITTQLTSRLALRTGLLVDIGKACTYGDVTYKASQNLMFEPQLGLAWAFHGVGKK